jgi:hypothetical protein
MIKLQERRVNMKKKIETVDVTPTWESVLLIYLEGWKNGSEASFKELKKMAQLADKFVNIMKDRYKFISTQMDVCIDSIKDDYGVSLTKKNLVEFIEYFKDNPQGKIENEIDSYMTGIEISEMNMVIEKEEKKNGI